MKSLNQDENYMNRCLELAQNGMREVAPNPMVGCVIVHQGEIIGEGFHQKYGQAHAEVNAIKSVQDQSKLCESTLYVNLEPCSHFGKTPPCADLIIEKGIKNVVIGCQDSFDKVAGTGIKKMEEAGINVRCGILEKESQAINKRFFTFHQKKRPYIVLKWAQTKDGFIDVERKQHEEPKINWITDPKLRVLVHKWRSEEAAIMIGAGTATNDNPRLDTREYAGKNPIRVLLDKHLVTPKNFNILDDSIPTLIYNSLKSEKAQQTEWIKINFETDGLKPLLHDLYLRNIQSVMVEGGKMLLESLIGESLWDEMRVFVGDKLFESGLKAPVINCPISEEYRLYNDRLLIFKNDIDHQL